jgi:hypothetical protein
MGFFSMLGKSIGNKTEIFLLDADSDKLIYQICKFNPHAVDGTYKSQFSEILKARYLNNTRYPKPLSIKEVALWKLVFYAKLLEFSDEVVEFEKVKRGISELYDELGESASPDIRLEAMVYAYDL